jgi:hypothetical protein
MTLQEFEIAYRSFARRRPFKPILVEVMSGDRVRISHPEALVRRNALLYFVGPGYHARLFASTSVCQLLDEPPKAPA